jgi:hypothetical protein
VLVLVAAVVAGLLVRVRRDQLKTVEADPAEQRALEAVAFEEDAEG